MFYKNLIKDEISKFSSKYIKINENEYLKCDFKKTLNKKCIVWLPGRNDYFFHYHFSYFFSEYDLYSINFRNSHHRRSDLFNHIDDLTEYFLEIDEVYNFFNINSYDEVILYGHSTGGLICILYEQYNKSNKISKMILNSPFLKFKRHWLENLFVNWIGWYLFDYFPNINISSESYSTNYYTKKLCETYNIDTTYKTEFNTPVISSWLINIVKHHKKITSNKYKVKVPTLILYCDKKTHNIFEENGDNILDIDENLSQVPYLFNDLSLLSLKTINDGIHDLLCSDGEILNNKTPLGKSFNYIKKFLF